MVVFYIRNHLLLLDGHEEMADELMIAAEGNLGASGEVEFHPREAFAGWVAPSGDGCSFRLTREWGRGCTPSSSMPCVAYCRDFGTQHFTTFGETPLGERDTEALLG
jgi:hypothetical protein